jgi:hypothetical protein
MIARKLFSELKKKLDRTENIRGIKNYTVIFLKIRERRRFSVAQANTSFVMLHTYPLFTSSHNNVDGADLVEVT